MQLFPTGAGFSANFDLVTQIVLAAALLGGTVLARRGQYRAHRYCQSAVVLLNLPLIAFIMVPSFHSKVQPGMPSGMGNAFHVVAVAHAAAGAVAEVLGLYIVLVAGTRLVPPRLRFRRYRPWMRTALALWWLATLAGVAVYLAWYGDV